jgi:hypothetical protein
MAYYNMVLTEAIFQLLEEKGLLKRQELKGLDQEDKGRDNLMTIRVNTTFYFARSNLPKT